MYALATHQLQVERRESHERNQVVCARHNITAYKVGGEREIIEANSSGCARPTHQLQVERIESHRANQVYALTTHQLQVERRRES